VALSLFDRQSGTRPEPTRLRQRLRLLVAAVAVAAVGAMLLFLAFLRQAAIDDATTRAIDAARLLEEHIVRTLRATDFIVGRVADLGRSHPMERLAADGKAWRELMSLNQGLPEPGTLWIIDAGGTVRLGTLKFPATPNSVLDRLYFTAHRDARRDLVIGPLVQVKGGNRQAFHLSRRIEEPDGRFLGVAVAGLDAGTFTDFYRTLPLGRKASISVADLEGRLIMRQPDPELWAGANISSGRLMSGLKRGTATGLIVSASPIDNVERLLAYRLVPEFGVVVMAGIAMEDVLAGWRQSVWGTVAVAGLLAAVLGTLIAITFSSLSREEELVRGLEETVRQRTEEAHAQAEEARRANESKTRFLAAASHDLRQPLQAAGMFVEALSARLEGSPLLGVVDKLRQSVDATQALLTTLLDVSTLEAGKIEPQVSSFSLMPLLANLYDQIEHETVAKNLSLNVVHTGARVLSDAVLLERMLRNLLINAARYTRQGGIVLGCRRRGDYLAICVVDTGEGIPDDKLDTIFDDFTRLGEKGSGASRGLGLGLGVVRRMALLLGHRVEVRSVVGKGSCFAVVVPLAK
jgi:Signal transduction histidine kinase